jgi:nitroimidazol reductase NimA-like FMN-containing flavoprotein (pyridoxamine 5'-phosphate oxidase superfamily)
MIGNLTSEQVEEFLQQGIVGHLGCHVEETTYVVPISYSYDGHYIYCHSHEGMKIDMMRKNPKVCFELDDMKDMANWRSVMLWGKYEELPNGKERETALESLLHRQLPVVSSITTHLGKEWPFPVENLKEIKGIVFRINIEKKTGRYESSDQSPSICG